MYTAAKIRCDTPCVHGDGSIFLKACFIVIKSLGNGQPAQRRLSNKLAKVNTK